MDRPRVVLAEDHPGVAEEMRKLLEAEFDVRVEARAARELVPPLRAAMRDERYAPPSTRRRQ
jgi:DNA-binding NarL/FixJ family response regulator